MRKPKNMTPIKIAARQPDCCAECPLLGIIPKGYPLRPKGSKETHVCLATREAMSGRKTKIRASRKDTNHPLRRPCDHLWTNWHVAGGGWFVISDSLYIEFRLPYERQLQIPIKFHSL